MFFKLISGLLVGIFDKDISLPVLGLCGVQGTTKNATVLEAMGLLWSEL